MAVHFMFAATTQFESVAVQGESIALWKLKDEIFNLKFRAAMEKRRVKERFDFRVFDAESKEEIIGADTRVRRHSRVLVKRLPAYVVSEAERKQHAVQQFTSPNSRACPIDDGFGDDVFSTPAASCVRIDRKQPAASGMRSDRNQPVSSHRNQDRIQSRANSATRLSDVTLESSSVVREIPRDLACSVCQDIMKDAVLIPCCCNSFCRVCVTDALLAHHKCPSCNSSKCKASDVLPNRSLNASIDLYHKANGTPTSSSTSSCFSAQSGLSWEHRRSESTHITAANVGEKRKLAPLSLSLATAKRSKPLIISLAPKANTFRQCVSTE